MIPADRDEMTMRTLKIAGVVCLGGLGLLKLGTLIIRLVQSDDLVPTVWFLKQAVYSAAMLSVAYSLWTSARSASEPKTSAHEAIPPAESADPEGNS